MVWGGSPIHRPVAQISRAPPVQVVRRFIGQFHAADADYIWAREWCCYVQDVEEKLLKESDERVTYTLFKSHVKECHEEQGYVSSQKPLAKQPRKFNQMALCQEDWTGKRNKKSTKASVPQM